MIKYSLIISTYNWHNALNLCLQSVLSQTQLPHELLIADDGSTRETKDLIAHYQNYFPIPLIHIWQEDKGFRKSKILNKALAVATGDYIIQIDGDVILHPKFIYDHSCIAEKNFFVVGSRTNLKEKYSKILIHKNELPSILNMRIWGKNKLNSFRIKLVSYILKNTYKTTGPKKYYAKGCNMAYWKEDILRINGYNEAFEGWGREDEDVVVRFFKLGLKKHFLKMSGIVFHIWHLYASRKNEEINKMILKCTYQHSSFRCEKGVDQYLYQDDNH